MKWIALAAPLAAALLLSSQTAPPERPGPLASGGVLLNTGWRLRPAGKQVPLSGFPMSSALAPDGKYLLVLNAGPGAPSISVLDTASAVELGRTPVPGAWLGLTFAPKGDRVYVGGGAQAAVFEFTFANGKLTPARAFPLVEAAKRTAQDFTGDVAFDPAGRLLYAADLFHDSIVVINPQSGTVIERFPTGRRPYRILFHPDGQSLFVSSWGDGAVYHHQAEKGSLLQKVRLGAHPTDMVWLPGAPAVTGNEKPDWTARLFVAASNTNNVYVVGVSESKSLRQIEAINVSLTAWQPAGTTPSALALSPDGTRLYIVCSDVNAVALADVSGLRAQPLGFMPTGWYPTAARVVAGDRLVVVNGRGASGSASFIDRPNDDQLEAYSRTVIENSPYRDTLLTDSGAGSAGPVPAQPNGGSPIRHVLYIITDSRGYDQLLGDGKSGAPNHLQLARDFVRFDNFYVNGDGEADGQDWSTSAIASDYVQKMPLASPGDPAATPPSGYLWTQAAEAGISLRNYGFFVGNRPLATVKDGVHVATVYDPILGRSTNPRFRGVDPAYPDVERAKIFLDDLAQYEKAGQLPQLLFMRLAGAAIGDHDAALGMIVAGVSHSRFWAETAIFVVENDARDGSDPLHPRRSAALLASPYARRGVVDSAMYNTTSVLRTMELILGLRPMTVFDAGARPMSTAFQSAPDARPYQAQSVSSDR